MRMKINELIASTLWWEGPAFLRAEVESCPKNVAVAKPTDNAKKEIKRTEEAYLVRQMTIDKDSRLSVHRYSSHKRIVRATACVLLITVG